MTEPTPASPPGASPQAPDSFPTVLPVLPLGDVVLFPHMILPLIINTPRSMRLIDAVASGARLLICVLQRDRTMPDDKVTLADLYEYGCVARLIKMLKFPDETIRVIVHGIARCRLAPTGTSAEYLLAHPAVLKDEVDDSLETVALARTAAQKFQEIVTLSPTLPDELKIAVSNVEGPGQLTDLIASHLNMSLEERQSLLEEYRVRERLKKLIVLLNREYEVLRIGVEIQHKVSENLAKSQREFFLREQMKTIQRELGEKDQQQIELQEIEKKIEAANMPPEVREVAEKEKARLATIPPASPEYAVSRTYLDWLTDLPWSVLTEDILDLRRARTILDEDHYDLTTVKERVLEFLAVLKLKRDLKGPILCFVGPPGVGKTSLGQSIARALGRKFVRMSLGGLRDEAEIRGHRRTYVGALPGRIIQGLRKAKSRNPVFMLDEIDKLGTDFRGDPAAALLEVLDPEQNHAFVDHYLDVPFDLSHVLFIMTANLVDPLPPALRDRMEILNLPGYTDNEKIHIARRYLVPKQLAAHGLKNDDLKLPRETLQRLIAEYTREAGVRNLERQIAALCRKAARQVAEGRKSPGKIAPQMLSKWLGPRQYDPEVAERKLEPGVAIGLAWTWAGGEILFIEATRMPGKGQLMLTGSLGDVMKESAQAALSFVRANGARWGISGDALKDADIHIHVPSGAIPKDGPSAGLAMLVALVSLLAQKPVLPAVAMTGEITLRGKVMPVGGIKEKVLAAARAGVRRVILPARNRRNFQDIPPEVRRKMSFTWVDQADEAIRAALGLRPKRPTRK